MGFDAHKNFAVSAVATAPSPATSGTSLVVTGGDGTKFPAVPFNATIWPTGAAALASNAEIVRVTAIATDTLTIVRAQEGSTARTVIVGDQIAATVTAKTATDIEAQTFATAVGNTTEGSTGTFASVGGRGAISVGMSNGTFEVSAPAASTFIGTNGVNLSISGSTISVSGWTTPEFEPFPLLNGLTTSWSGHSIGSVYLQPFLLPANISGGRLNRLTQFGSTASILRESSTNYGSGTSGSRSVDFQYSNIVGLYSLGAGTNSTRLESCWSSMFSLEIKHSVSVSSSQPHVTVGGSISYLASIDSLGGTTTSSYTASGTGSSATTSFGSSAMTSVLSSIRNVLSGSLMLPVPLNTTVTPGQYWLAQYWSTASTTAGTSADALSIAATQTAIYGNANMISHRVFGQTVSTSGSALYPGQGVFSATATALPATIALSDIRTIASQLVHYFNYANSAI